MKVGPAYVLHVDKTRFFAFVDELQMVIFHFEESGDWNQATSHSNIKMCTTWYIS